MDSPPPSIRLAEKTVRMLIYNCLILTETDHRWGYVVDIWSWVSNPLPAWLSSRWLTGGCAAAWPVLKPLTCWTVRTERTSQGRQGTHLSLSLSLSGSDRLNPSQVGSQPGLETLGCNGGDQFLLELRSPSSSLILLLHNKINHLVSPLRSRG